MSPRSPLQRDHYMLLEVPIYASKGCSSGNGHDADIALKAVPV